MTEQINQESNDSVETPKDATDVFTEILEAEESVDKPEVTNEEVATEAVEETDEEALEEEVEEESEEDEPEATEEEDEDSDEVEVEERKTFRVKANGEEKDVTLDELVSGYQKGEDYTKKSQALADQRKAVEAEAHAVNEAMQMREQYAQRLSQVQALLQQEGDDGVDMAELKENDPIQYAIKVAEKTENNKKLQLLQQEQNNLAQAQQQQVAQHQAKLVAHEANMLTEKVKEFSDPKKAEQLKGEIRNFGKSIGFTDDELAQVYDHRHVMVMQKAMEYDKLQKAKPGVTKKLVKAPKMAKKGNKVANVDVYTKQKKRLKSSGSIEDATSVFTNFI
jgi:hypothetical protein